jgi:hypothetical protein
MDLLKMHPMARKLTAHNEAFAKAIESGNADDAKSHLNEIMKYASTLEEDLLHAIKKADTEVVTPDNGWVNNVPVLKWNESGSKFDTSQRDRQLKGTIISSRNNSQMKKASGTFGRWSN